MVIFGAVPCGHRVGGHGPPRDDAARQAAEEDVQRVDGGQAAGDAAGVVALPQALLSVFLRDWATPQAPTTVVRLAISVGSCGVAFCAATRAAFAAARFAGADAPSADSAVDSAVRADDDRAGGAGADGHGSRGRRRCT